MLVSAFDRDGDGGNASSQRFAEMERQWARGVGYLPRREERQASRLGLLPRREGAEASSRPVVETGGKSLCAVSANAEAKGVDACSVMAFFQDERRPQVLVSALDRDRGRWSRHMAETGRCMSVGLSKIPRAEGIRPRRGN